MTYRFRDDLRRNWSWALVLLAAAAVWGWFDVQRRGRIDPTRIDAHKTDFTVYTEAGAAFFDGRDPYTVTNIRGWSYLYPPLLAIAVAPLASLDSQLQTFIWFAVSVGFAAGCYVETRRLLAAAHLLFSFNPEPTATGECGLPPVAVGSGLNESVQAIRWPAWLALGTACLPAMNCIQRGQIGVLQLYCLLLGFRWIVTRPSAWHALAGGVVLALPVVLKITPALPVGCLLLMLAVQAVRRAESRTRAAASLAGVVLGTALWLLAIPGAILGWESNLRHLTVFSTKVLDKVSNVRDDDFGGEIDSPRNQSLDNALYRLGLWLTYKPDVDADGRTIVHVDRPRLGELPRVPLVSRIAWTVSTLLAAAMLIQALALGWDGRPLALGLGFGLACALSLIISPVSRGHYFVMLLPAVLYASLWLTTQGRTRAAWFAGVTPAALTMLHYLSLNSAGRLGLYGLAMAAWYIALCVLIVPPAWFERLRMRSAGFSPHERSRTRIKSREMQAAANAE